MAQVEAATVGGGLNWAWVASPHLLVRLRLGDRQPAPQLLRLRRRGPRPGVSTCADPYILRLTRSRAGVTRREQLPRGSRLQTAHFLWLMIMSDEPS
jgi:hypothetical protein